MTEKNRPGNYQTLLFFVGFILLFFLVFALGVIVGKGLTDFETLLSENNKFRIFAKKDNSESEKENSVVENNNFQDTSMVEVSEVEIEPIAETNNDVDADEVENAVTIIEDGPEKKESPDKKKSEKNDAAEKPKEKKESDKEEKNNVVAKLDYGIPEFPKTDPGGKYTVQLGSFQNIDTAYKLEKSLNQKGYPSFVIKAVIPEKGTWYRVRVGTFNNKEKAGEYGKKIKNKEKLEFVQITLNN